MTPSGTTQSFAGSTEPPGWLFCFGQSLNATTNPIYADLFSAIGTTYGGSGVTAFSLPDLRGRSITGRDNMGGTAASRVTNSGTNNSGIAGSTLGAVGGDQRMHQHTHTQNSHSHSYSRGINIGFQHTPGSSTAYFHTYDTPQTGGTTATNQNTGTGTAQNMPPTIILNYIIKI
jgi:microcystin-dependent protein